MASNAQALNTLRHLRNEIAKLGQPGSPARISLARALGEAALSATQEGFRTSSDPYGRPWVPLKSRAGQPLSDTGRHLRDRFSYTVTPGGFVLRQETWWATTHQYGATIVPRNKKHLAFRVRGNPTKSNRRGRLSGWIFADRVVIPRRQMVPERNTGGVGPRFGRAMNEAADLRLRALLGVR